MTLKEAWKLYVDAVLQYNALWPWRHRPEYVSQVNALRLAIQWAAHRLTEIDPKFCRLVDIQAD